MTKGEISVTQAIHNTSFLRHLTSEIYKEGWLPWLHAD